MKKNSLLTISLIFVFNSFLLSGCSSKKTPESIIKEKINHSLNYMSKHKGYKINNDLTSDFLLTGPDGEINKEKFSEFLNNNYYPNKHISYNISNLKIKKSGDGYSANFDFQVLANKNFLSINFGFYNVKSFWVLDKNTYKCNAVTYNFGG